MSDDVGLLANLASAGKQLALDLAAAGSTLWHSFDDDPETRAQLIAITFGALLVLGVVWFVHGLRFPRRKCAACRGRGGFDGRWWKRDRKCGCCEGSGRHVTVPMRTWRKIRGRAS